MTKEPSLWSRLLLVVTSVIQLACPLFVLLSLAISFARGSGTTDPSTAASSTPTAHAGAAEGQAIASATPMPAARLSAAFNDDEATGRLPTRVSDAQPTATPEPSPTSPPSPTATQLPTATPSPAPTSTPFSLDMPQLAAVTPAVSDTTPIPTPVPQAPVAPGTINIVLLGSDRRPDWTDWHTDVVQVVSVQPSVPAVTVLSIPRDLYVYIPDFWMSRINFADMYGEVYGYAGGGPALVQQTMLYNLGIPIDHYVRVDFSGFKGVVDILGGVDIPVHCRLEDYWPYPDENGDYPRKVVEPGLHHMDGATALWYSRSRKTSSVFARERRQQQVLEAIWRKSRSLDVLPHLPQLWEQYRSMVVTDLNLIDVARLAEVAFRLDAQHIRMLNIGYQHVIPWTTPKGGNVFLPNWEEMGPVVAEALGPFPQDRLWRTMQTVDVWNGTPNPGWDHLAADRLWRVGFAAVMAQPDHKDYAQTTLLDFTTPAQGSAASQLRWMFGIAPENVISAPDPNGSAQYRLIIGADYQTCRSP